MAKIFISYSRRDREIVENFYNVIKSDGHDVWYDRMGIHVADMWMEKIEEAIEMCDVFIYFSSVNSNTKPIEPKKKWYTQIEVSYALDQKKTIIPILIDDTPFPRGTRAELKRLHYIDYSQGFQESYKELDLKFQELNFTPLPKGTVSDSEYDDMIKILTDDAKTKILTDKEYGNKPEFIPIEVENVSFEMILVEGGEYSLESNCKKEQLEDYYIGKFVVTQKLWKTVMGRNPSKSNKGEKHPVENVSWNECWNFIEKLNDKTNLIFSLPNELEWEFAAKGGRKSKGYKYSGSNIIDDVAWYGNLEEQTHEVGQKKPNELGIYDMSGNVNEWCIRGTTIFNSRNKSHVNNHILRGGSFASNEKYCEICSRPKEEKISKTRFWGLRLVLRTSKI